MKHSNIRSASSVITKSFRTEWMDLIGRRFKGMDRRLIEEAVNYAVFKLYALLYRGEKVDSIPGFMGAAVRHKIFDVLRSEKRQRRNSRIRLATPQRYPSPLERLILEDEKVQL